MSIYLKNARYINYETFEITNTHIKVDKGFNNEIEFLDILPEYYNTEDVIIDCKNNIVTHSFVNAHHHVYSALARGMNPPKVIPSNFYEILKYVWWALDKCLDADMIRLSALVTAMTCAKNGVTFVIDHHASPFYIKNSLNIIAEAFDEVGVSHLLCYEITDRDGLDKAEDGLIETEEYLKKRQGLVGLHASFTISDNTLNKAVELTRKFNSGIHIHVAEDKYDQDFAMENYNKRVIERLAGAGVLDFSKTILAHCIHINEIERDIIANSPCWVVQNAESNLNNNVGFFNSEGLSDRIMLGTDGMHSDMLRSAKAAFLIGQPFDKVKGGLTYKAAYQRFRRAHDYISKNGFIGDDSNNLVVLDYDSPTPVNESNFVGHFIFGIESRHVKHVISSGDLILHDGKLVNVDESEILEQSQKIATELWELMSK
ncbi:MAG TPA: amidohydrolase family protein [Bacteroidales bacterium]|nr:amidohydrolase family protein [Bacteroidales bacterium]